MGLRDTASCLATQAKSPHESQLYRLNRLRIKRKQLYEFSVL